MNQLVNPVEAAPPVACGAPFLMITLVHGTFAPGAEWTQPNSTMRCQWPVMPERPVDFNAPDWGGENSHRARIEGSETLANSLRGLPGAMHLVIAHSHGGNVALGALAAKGVASKVNALICLNTPFLHYAKRNLFPLWAALIAVNPATLLLLGFIAFGLDYLFPHDPGEYWSHKLIVTLLRISMGIPVFCAGFISFKLSSWLVDKIKTYQLRRLEELHWYADPGCPVLPATVKQDEAYWYLWLVDRITGATALGGWIGSFLCCGGAFIMIFAISPLGLLEFYYWFPAWAFEWVPALTRAAVSTSSYCALMVGAGACLFFISTIIMTVTSAVLRRHKFSYGEQILDSLFLRISVKPYPSSMGKEKLRYFEAASPGWKHSALYGSTDVVRSLSKWFYGLPEVRQRMKSGELGLASHNGFVGGKIEVDGYEVANLERKRAATREVVTC